MPPDVHARKSSERGKAKPFFYTVTTKCGLTLEPVHGSEVNAQSSVWNSDITCPSCRNQ